MVIATTTDDRGVDTARRSTAKSEALYKAAEAVMPISAGGPLTGGTAVEPGSGAVFATPILERGKGCRVTDVDGEEYVDYTAAGGVNILGYGDQRVAAAINKAIFKGGALGTLSSSHLRLAELLVSRIPSLKMVRFVASRGQALLAALDIARRVTGRRRVITFSQRSGAIDDAVELPYNDRATFEGCFAEIGDTVAAIVLEPVFVDRGLARAEDEFVTALRRACDESSALLIVDESMTAFRAAGSGQTTTCNVPVDLMLLGGVLSGGLPLAALGGRADLMKQAAAIGPAGEPTESAGLPAIAAGLAALEAMAEPGFHEALEASSAKLDKGLREAARLAQVPTVHARVGSLVGIYFPVEPVENTAGAVVCDATRFARFHGAMLDRGVLLTPDPLGCMFVSAAHGDEAIEQTVAAAREAMDNLP
ncbi:MAG: aminotransferase class III-fold pyridoxal phosphate-dependent enzyme [Phycisphaerae bacterium]